MLETARTLEEICVFFVVFLVVVVVVVVGYLLVKMSRSSTALTVIVIVLIAVGLLQLCASRGASSAVALSRLLHRVLVILELVRDAEFRFRDSHRVTRDEKRASYSLFFFVTL